MTPSATRNLLRRGRLGVCLRWTALLAVVATQAGCNYLLLVGYLIGGPPSIEPDFDIMTRQSMTDKGVTVAVVCYAPTEVKWDFEEVDNEIAKYVALRLFNKKIKIVHPDRIRSWLDRNPDWDKPEEIGAAVDASHVIYIDLQKYSLYEEHSANLYRGRAEALVSVFELDEDGYGEKIYSKDITSRFPLTIPRSTSETSYQNFKRQYLSRLSEEIGRLFYEHYSGEDIPDAI